MELVAQATFSFILFYFCSRIVTVIHRHYAQNVETYLFVHPSNFKIGFGKRYAIILFVQCILKAYYLYSSLPCQRTNALGTCFPYAMQAAFILSQDDDMYEKPPYAVLSKMLSHLMKGFLSVSRFITVLSLTLPHSLQRQLKEKGMRKQRFPLF